MSVDRELLTNLLKKTGQARLRVAGSSMVPTLRIGDTILIQASDQLLPDVGELVTFMQGNVLCTHRVAAVSGSKLVTRGDGNRYDDSPIEFDMCLGRVVRVERNGRTLPTAALHRKRSPSRYLRLCGEWVWSHRGAIWRSKREA